MRAYLARRYQQRRNMCIEKLGGKCVNCGSDLDLEFDHIDRSTKSSTIANMLIGSLSRLLKELEKCQLLCSVCHDRKTGRENGVPHGGGVRGKAYCKCEPCKKQNRKYSNMLRARRKLTGVEEFGRPRGAHNAEIAGSNPAPGTLLVRTT